MYIKIDLRIKVSQKKDATNFDPVVSSIKSDIVLHKIIKMDFSNLGANDFFAAMARYDTRGMNRQTTVYDGTRG